MSNQGRSGSDGQAWLDSLQAQLDSFMEQEVPQADEPLVKQAGAIQEQADPFIDGLRRQLDTLMQQGGPRSVSQLHRTDMVDALPQEHVSSSDTATASVSTGFVDEQSDSRSSRSVLGAGIWIIGAAMIMVVLWYFWAGFQNSSGEQLRAGNASMPADSAAVALAQHQRQETTLASQAPMPGNQTVSENDRAEAVRAGGKPVAGGASAVPDAAGEDERAAGISENSKSAAASVQARPSSNMALEIGAAIGRVRIKPDLRSKVVARLKRGSLVTMLARKGDWYHIRMANGKTGWAHHSIF